MTTAPPMTKANLTDALKRLGWRIRNDVELDTALRDFQRGWALGEPLAVDGKNGPKTRTAVRASLDRLKAGKPTVSEHFSWSEFACHCRGRYADCRRIRLHHSLVTGLERYRARVGKPVTIVAGYRCPRHNAAVGGATNSQHLYGAAADLSYALLDAIVAKLRVFSGIGRSKKTGLVRHVDVRHVSGNNTTGGTPDRPTRWIYAA